MVHQPLAISSSPPRRNPPNAKRGCFAGIYTLATTVAAASTMASSSAFVIGPPSPPTTAFGQLSSAPGRPTSILTATTDGTGIPETYPLSRRKSMLIEESSKIDGGRQGSYSPAGWSNRLGSVLTPASIPGVYTADRPFYWNKIDVGCRMTVIQLGSSNNDGACELLIHSPVGLDDRLAAAVEALGTVAHVVSPNYEHVKYAGEWARRYPNAKTWGCPGMAEREPENSWSGELPFGARPAGFVGGNTSNDATLPKGMWDWNEVQPLHIDTEVNPFTGRAFFNEVIYYHAPSKTLLTTDLYWNYPSGDGVTNGQISDAVAGVVKDDVSSDFGVWELAPEVGPVPFGSSAWKFGMDKLFYPFYMNLMVKDEKRGAFDDIARFVIGEWEVETIIPAHGDIIRGRASCRKILEGHFGVVA